ncbi:glucosamine-6-phosphate deaminase [candidate division KSB3 bacterium]|uniref:Glucosamine-6-phosphate deaminase n=1 Tax=candidate division KSB3 bacterium TaxID=2044937 RepID=A0A2G6E6K9_9BACT|nr:MAG: glucosamine-6-phosphate deaminase [candidate division KSB3 bacterium]PIE30132.1 MAG: glucosamine-6-phosphate deaminase [candidate division KSB3 bacterium]
MHSTRYSTSVEMGQAAAECGAEAIRQAIRDNGRANIILATGASQFEMLNALVGLPDIEWSKVTVFHLDEYIAMPETHPASFRKYLKERFVAKLPTLKAFHFVEGDRPDPAGECLRLGRIIVEHPIDTAFIGIGENGHLAFNDPPADFEIEDPYIVVELDEACRKQQLGEGWFESLDDVPTQAISMSIRHIMKSRRIIVTVPDERKAQAVKSAVEGEVCTRCPASILQTHADCHLFMDTGSSKLLSDEAPGKRQGATH